MHIPPTFGLLVMSLHLSIAAIPLDDKGIVIAAWEPASINSLAIPKSILLPNQTVNYKTLELSPSTAKISSITSDPKTGSLFLFEAQSRAIYIRQNFNIWQNESLLLKKLHDGITLTLCQIAYDYVSNNIYWTDNYFDWICMKSVLSNDSFEYSVIIHEDLNEPEAIAVDPKRGYLFFVNNQPQGRIERAYMDGRYRRVLVHTSISRILGLTVDTNNEILFWVDSIRHTIERVGYDGQNRQVIQRRNKIAFTSVHFYKNVLHMAVPDAKLILGVDSSSGHDIYRVEFKDKPFSIHVYNAENITEHKDPCLSKGCKQFCVNTPTGAACLCQEGFDLQADGKSCNDNSIYHKRGVMMSNRSSIFMLEIQSFNKLSTKTPYLTIPNANISSFVADAVNQMIYYIDGTKRELGQLNIVSKKFQRLTSFVSAKDLVLDWILNCLFWIDSSSKIKLFSLTSRSTITLYSGLQQPKALTINPHTGKLFWISGIIKKHIVQGDIIGTKSNIILSFPNLQNPSSLLYDVTTNRLYWADNRQLKSCLQNGTDISSHAIIGRATEILVYKDHIGWVNGRQLSYSRRSTSKRLKADAEASFSLSYDMTAFYVYDSYLQKDRRGSCDILNGGCEDICIPTYTGRKCECDFGFDLQPDGTSCGSTPMDNNFAIVADYTHGRLLQIDLNYGNVTKLDITAKTVPGITLDKFSKDVFYSEVTSRAIYSTDLNGQIKSQIYTTGFSHADRLAIDYSTGNLFYTAVSLLGSSMSYIAVIHRKTYAHKTLMRGLYSAREIALYPAKGFLFWTEFGNVTEIGRCNMDGSSKTYIATVGIGWPNGLTIDYKADKLYWTDGKENRIEYSDLNGANRRTLLTDNNAHLMSIVLYGDYLYYTAWNRQQITKINKNTGLKLSFMKNHPEFGRLDSLDIYPGEVQKVNSYCKRKNGFCSTFCLPTSSGRACGCEDGVSLLLDRKTCTGVQRCASSILNGNLLDCPPYPGQSCEYKCINGYKPKSENTTIVCQSTGKWNKDITELCARVLCSPLIPNGRLSAPCSRAVGETCTFNCNRNFETTASGRLICKPNGTWNKPLSSLCRRTIRGKHCPASLPKVIISPTCNRTVGVSCSFSCIETYEISTSIKTLICKSDGSWNQNADNLCRLKVLQCPLTIPNGKLQRGCNRTIGEECKFTCNSGYETTSFQKSLICKSDLTWAADLNSLCTLKVSQCHSKIPNGELQPSCNKTIGEECTFKCNSGYESTSSYQSLICKSDLTWSMDIDSLCLSRVPQCQSLIQNGILDRNCNRTVGEECSFACDNGFVSTSASRSLVCKNDVMWNMDTKNLCKLKGSVTLCPWYIPHATLSSTCTRTAGTTCTFTCSKNYESLTSTQTLTCSSNGTWDQHIDKLCQPKRTMKTVQDKKQNKIVIIGAGVGGVLFLIAIVIVIFICRRQKQNQRNARYQHTPSRRLQEMYTYQDFGNQGYEGGRQSDVYDYIEDENDRCTRDTMDNTYLQPRMSSAYVSKVYS